MTHPHTTHPTTGGARARCRRRPLRNDDGSLLLVILFTIMMTALVLVVVATMIAGLAKTKNSRDYAIALQAADIAFADATVTATMNPTQFTALPVGGTTTGSGTAGTGDIRWEWVATRNANPANTWTIKVTATGQNMDREFSSTLKGTKVKEAKQDPTTGAIRYEVQSTQHYEFGFFGDQSFQITADSNSQFDGYNGATGQVGSNNTVILTAADGTEQVDQIDLWNWTTDTGRCTGPACDTAQLNRIKTKAAFATATINSYCTPTDPKYQGEGGHWTASSGTQLRAGYCYDSLTFDTNYNLGILGSHHATEQGVVYVRGNITVNPGVHVNAKTGLVNADTKTHRFATLGNFTQEADSRIGLALYAPLGTCTVKGPHGQTNNYSWDTLWMGAGTCKTFTVYNNARFRVDGGLVAVNAADYGVGTWVFESLDYESLS